MARQRNMYDAPDEAEVTDPDAPPLTDEEVADKKAKAAAAKAAQDAADEAAKWPPDVRAGASTPYCPAEVLVQFNRLIDVLRAGGTSGLGVDDPGAPAKVYH